MSSPLLTPDGRTASRRGFLKRAGLGVGVLASASALQACDSNTVELPGVATVTGRVTDGDGNGVSGATVSLSTGATTTTDSDGRYTFNDVATSDAEVTVTVAATEQYPEESSTLRIVAGGTTYFSDFVLGTVMLDFSNDFGVLNYAYALEQLEAAFYATVVGSGSFGSTFNADEQAILRDLAAHEAIHRDFLAAAISGAGGTPIIGLTPTFDAVDFDNRSSVLGTAQVFEDLGVAAYNGAGRYLESDVYLTIAGKIVSIEARHASVVSGLLSPNALAGAGVIDAAGLDRAFTPDTVLAAADPFIVNALSAVNVPTT